MSGAEIIQLVIISTITFLICLLVLVAFLWVKLERLDLSGSFSLEILKGKFSAELQSRPSKQR